MNEEVRLALISDCKTFLFHYPYMYLPWIICVVVVMILSSQVKYNRAVSISSIFKLIILSTMFIINLAESAFVQAWATEHIKSN